LVHHGSLGQLVVILRHEAVNHDYDDQKLTKGAPTLATLAALAVMSAAAGAVTAALIAPEFTRLALATMIEYRIISGLDTISPATFWASVAATEPPPAEGSVVTKAIDAALREAEDVTVEPYCQALVVVL